MKELSWEELKATEVGKILHDQFDEGIRFIIMRGPCSLCAYIGIPIEHPLANKGYDDLPVECHGGLTFASKGEDNYPKGYFWYGWDYSHCDDKSFYDGMYGLRESEAKEWLVKDVINDSWSAIYDFKKLMKLAESIKGA